MTKIKKWYTLEKSTNKWVVWQNGEGEHSYGSYGIFRSESKKECLNFCKEKGIKLSNRKIDKILQKVKCML